MSDAGLTHSSLGELDAARIDSWVTAVEAAWRRLGVTDRNRRRMAAELQTDIETARAAGAGLDSLLSYDVASFAKDLADANQALPADRAAPPHLSDVVVTLLSGGLLGAILSWFVVIPGLEGAMTRASDLTSAVIIYGICGALTLLMALAAVQWRFRDGPGLDRQALLKVGLGFTLGGIAGIVPAMLFAASTAYSGAGIVMLLEVAIVAAFCAAGIALAWPLRRVRARAA